MALPDYSQYFTEDFNNGPIIDPKIDFRPRKAYYLSSQKDIASYLRNKGYGVQKQPEPVSIPKVELRIKKELKELNPMHIQALESFNFRPYFWFLLACLTLVPLINSSIHNVVNLTQNIGSDIRLFKEREKLRKDNQELVNKLQEYHSYSGMKRTIKEEIKVIEKNEILIKITK